MIPKKCKSTIIRTARITALGGCMYFMSLVFRSFTTVHTFPSAVDLSASYSHLVVSANETTSKLLSNPPWPKEPDASNQTIDYYITTLPTGRLGNQMFSYASLLGIARMNRRQPLYPTMSSLNKFFLIKHHSDQSSNDFEIVYETSFAAYDPKFESLPPKNILLLQYFQSWKYFHFMKEDILREFTFRPYIKDDARILLKRCTTHAGDKIKIGVHIRRGDWLSTKHVNRGFRGPSVSYYNKAAAHMRSKYHDVIFVVVTDDINWCRKHVHMKDFVVADRASPEVHLALLTLCDHVIMSVGTFGWWGGYLAGGEVVYYANHTHSNTTASSNLSPGDHFLPHWIGLGD